MKLLMLVVRDRASDAFGTPHFVASRGSGIRNFADELNRVDSNNLLNKHPDDFDLYEIGVYDDTTAEITLSERKQIAVGKDLVVKRV